jgi:hypothetical protein
VNHLQDIILLPASPGQILTEVLEVILFRQEAAWNEAVIHHLLLAVLLQEVADHLADRQVLTLQAHLLGLLQGLPQVAVHHHVVVAVVLLQEDDSLKQ